MRDAMVVLRSEASGGLACEGAAISVGLIFFRWGSGLF